jgi:hypothetical protein
MKLSRPRPVKRYKTVRLEGKRHLKKRPYIIPLLGLVLGLCIVTAIWVSGSSGQTFRPSGAHVVFLFDNGQRRVLDTRAETVGDLIKRLNLHLIDQDVVERARHADCRR